jgi:hypothetical protein
VADDPKSNDPNAHGMAGCSPAAELAKLGRTGELEKRIEECFKDRDDQLVDRIGEVVGEELSSQIKPHIDDVMQIVIETIDQRLADIPKPPEKTNDRFGFWIGLGIGASLFLGFGIGMLVRGLL